MPDKTCSPLGRIRPRLQDGHLGNDWAWRAGVRSEYAIALDAWNLAPLGLATSDHGRWPQDAFTKRRIALGQQSADRRSTGPCSGRVVRMEAYGKR